jgi:hypothetical protein
MNRLSARMLAPLKAASIQSSAVGCDDDGCLNLIDRWGQRDASFGMYGVMKSLVSVRECPQLFA